MARGTVQLTLTEAQARAVVRAIQARIDEELYPIYDDGEPDPDHRTVAVLRRALAQFPARLRPPVE